MAVLVAGTPSLFRPGYSPDEEFTLFAVRGIHAHGLPLLPSALVYDRGLAYSYLSWFAGLVTGWELPAYRAISLLSAVVSLALVFTIARRLTAPVVVERNFRSAFSASAAFLATTFVATSLPFWSVATTGRFYATFMAAWLSVAVVFSHLSHLSHLRTLALLAALSFLCRLTHELAFTLLAIPLLMALMSKPQDFKSSGPLLLKASAALVAGLVVSQVVLFGLHYAAPASGDTMIRRFFVWQVLNLFERPPAAQVGVVLSALVVAWLVVPKRAGLSTVIGLCGTAMVLAFAMARATAAAPVSFALVAGVLEASSRYPLDMLWHIAHANPVTLGLALVLLVARLLDAGGEWTGGERAAHVGWVGWVLWFGVLDSGITINYLLMPVTLMLAAIAIDLVAVAQHAAALWPGPRAQMIRAGLVMVALLVVADQWRGTGSVADRLAVARPTIDVPGVALIRDGLQPDDRVACTDELACLVIMGRADAWLALDDFVRERFVVTRQGQQTGVYTGAPAVFRPNALFTVRPNGHMPARVIVVDVFKGYPIGNSSTWLPRAIDADGLESRTLLETAQARIVEISVPLRNARAP